MTVIAATMTVIAAPAGSRHADRPVRLRHHPQALAGNKRLLTHIDSLFHIPVEGNPYSWRSLHSVAVASHFKGTPYVNGTCGLIRVVSVRRHAVR